MREERKSPATRLAYGLDGTMVCSRRRDISCSRLFRCVLPPPCLVLFVLICFHHCCSPAQLVGGYYPQRPSGQSKAVVTAVATGVFFPVPPPPAPRYLPSFWSCIGFGIPTFQLFMMLSSVCIEFRQLTRSLVRPVDWQKIVPCKIRTYDLDLNSYAAY